jgi:threonine dehydrogenase-like Zn-dependent dehydrogenase
MVLRSTDASVELAGKHEDKLARARELGLTCIQVAQVSACSADIVVDSTGSQHGLALAIATARPRGTVVMKTTVAQTSAIDMSPVVVKELTMVGSRCGPFPRAIEALASNQITVDTLVDARYPLERGMEAMERAATPGILKVLIDVWKV